MRLSSICLALALFSQSLYAATIEELIKELEPKWDALKSIHLEMEQKLDLQSEQMTVSSTSQSVFEMQRKGEVLLTRLEVTQHSTSTSGGETRESANKSLVVNDGGVQWTEIVNEKSTPPEKRITKAKPTPAAELKPTNVLRKFAQQAGLLVVADEKVGDELCHVIEVHTEGQPARFDRYWFSVRCGVMLKSESKTSDGKPIANFKVTKLNIDADLPAEHFVYTPPKEAQVEEAK